MKRILFLALSLNFVFALSQFQIDGTIKGAEKQYLFLFYTDGSNRNLVDKVQLNEKGEFSIEFPMKHTGLVTLELGNGKSIYFMNNNKDVQFKAETQDGGEIVNVEYTKGDLPIAFNEYTKHKELRRIEKEFFPMLKSVYSQDDEFYHQIEKESRRLNDTVNDVKLNKHEEIRYIGGLDRFLDNKINSIESIENRILNDPNIIVTSGLFSNVLFSYLQNNARKASSEEDLPKVISESLNHILKKADLATRRGQKILEVAFEILPKTKFPEIHEEYLSKISTLDDQLTENLKILVASNKIKVGEKAPNFKFYKKQNKKKSLYHIKSDEKLLVFWASWCPACVNEMPFIEDYYKSFKKEGGEIIAIALDYDESDFENATKDYTWYNHSDLLKWDSPTAKLYGINSTPTLILLDKNNVIVKIGSKLSDILE